MLASLLVWSGLTSGLLASSHREAPLIANDPLADNTDLYAFRSPDDPNSVTIIANYVPLQLPHGGPNYYQFGENVRYEIHVDNDVSTPGDDIIYRFTFDIENEDPTTFFNIRLGMQNLKTTYTMERSVDGGQTFATILTNGIVPPNNIGARSISGGAGLNTDYASLFSGAIGTASTGEKVFAGPVDDPFFVDLGGIFDLGDSPRQSGTPKDGVACKNVSTIAIQVPISALQKDGKDASQAANILDGEFVIGVWASASRKMIRTVNEDGTRGFRGPWVQVSRLGMPLTNEAVIPIGQKDEWNARTPYNEDANHFEYFYNPELALYMDDSLFGGAVPGFAPLRIQRNSLGMFDFGNGQDGLFGLKGNPALAGTALDDAIFGTLLLPAAGKPRSVDLWPIFHTGVPNLEPYQLATGKGGNPLATGKPFINNFLPNGGDMLRLNMATPTTDRNDPAFSTLGLVQAAVLGLTDPTYAGNANLEFIPNMDGFPNGRRLEDDVTRIELQAVGGVVLAAIGLWYDDYDPATSPSPVTQDLLDVLTYTTGVEANDTTFRMSFPYEQTPWSGTGKCGGQPIMYQQPTVLDPTGNPGAPLNLMVNTDTAFLAPLSWTDNSTSELGFIIRRSSPTLGMQTVDTVGANVTTYIDTVLIFGENVDYVVVAFDGAGESDSSNVATYALPNSFQQLTLSYVCYSPGVDSLTWTVTNPNSQIAPFIWAQFYSGQRDTLFARPGTSMFLTANNAQDPTTVGDDNITGIYYPSGNGASDEDVVFNDIDLTIDCGSLRRPDLPWASQALFMPWANVNQGTTELEAIINEKSLQVMPNPFRDQVQLILTDLTGTGTVRLLDNMGRVVRTQTIDLSENQTLQLGNLPGGVYLLEVQAGEFTLNRKLIKQ
jgi:hypothetical protein